MQGKDFTELSEIKMWRKNKPVLSIFGERQCECGVHSGNDFGRCIFDEVALQNRDFVEQAVARCSIEGSKFWFNCNPEHPGHWFYTDWICRRKEKNLCYLHFRMEDNPSLSVRMRRRYENLYSGNFYERFVLGKWVQPQGLVYPMFSKERHVLNCCPECRRFLVSCDYGTVNPCSMGLWGEADGVWYRLDEYYYDSRKEGVCRTDEEHYAQLEHLCTGKQVEAVIVDPSAASFIECIRRHGKFRVIPAKIRCWKELSWCPCCLIPGRYSFCKIAGTVSGSFLSIGGAKRRRKISL